MLSNQSKNQSPASVPSSTEERETAVTAGQAKISKAGIITLIGVAILTIAATCLFICDFSLQYTWGLIVGLVFIMFEMIIMITSDIIHNRMKVVTGAMLIALAVLTVVGLLLLVIAKSGV